MKAMLNMTCQSRNLKLKHFMERHKEVFQDPIVSTFFNQNFHQQLLQDALHGNQRAKQQLEISFRKYFFHFRFSKYIRSTIRFGSITLDRKRRIYHERNHLILDNEIIPPVEEILHANNKFIEKIIDDPQDFLATIEQEWLFFAFSKLTPKQKIIITLSYSVNLLDKEIAEHLNISQQAVCKTRNIALNHMKNYFSQGRKDNFKKSKAI